MQSNVYILVIVIICINAISASKATKNYKKQFNNYFMENKDSDEEFLFSKSKSKKDMNEKISVNADDKIYKKAELKKQKVPVFKCIYLLSYYICR